MPKWREHLRTLPPYTPGVRLSHDAREQYATAVAAAHRDGGGKQTIARALGCSNTFVNQLLDIAEGLEEGSEAHLVETTLRARIADGTYRVGDALPSRKRLCGELGVEDRSVLRALARLAHAQLTLGINPRGTVVIDPSAPPAGPTIEVRVPSGEVETWAVPMSQSPDIREVITARIADGTYPEGSKIPGVQLLGREFGASEGVVRSAVQLLKRQGVLTGSRAGTFVHASARVLLRRSAQDQSGADCRSYGKQTTAVNSDRLPFRSEPSGDAVPTADPQLPGGSPSPDAGGVGSKEQGVTDRQWRILNYIRETVRQRGFPPSLREIGESVGLSAASSVASQLRTLERKGLVTRHTHGPRSYQVVADGPAGQGVPALTYVGCPLLAGDGVGGGEDAEGAVVLRVMLDPAVGRALRAGALLTVRQLHAPADAAGAVADATVLGQVTAVAHPVGSAHT
ncbi:GntR family transcriptional regulator [Streptomyces sp. NPDC048281]|uniref:GntR family transcriptional regulator n=1 Tax=Streptomyces sp. NPDC048281 TaxID=3154715 RepID=UPI003426FAED